MRQNVSLESTPLTKVCLTHRTLVTGASTVHNPVDCQRACLAETFTTITALQGPFLGVNVSVVPQVVISSEGLATNVTREGPLICVRSLVNLYIVALGELTVAKLANESLLRTRGPGVGEVESWVVRRWGGGGGRSKEPRVGHPLAHEQGVAEGGQEEGGGGGGPGEGGGGQAGPWGAGGGGTSSTGCAGRVCGGAEWRGG